MRALLGTAAHCCEIFVLKLRTSRWCACPPDPSGLDFCRAGKSQAPLGLERESLPAPNAFAGTASVRCDVAAPAILGAKLVKNGLENLTVTGRPL